MAKAGKLRSRKRRKSKTSASGLNLNQASLLGFVLFSLILTGAAFISQLPSLSALHMQRSAMASTLAERAAHELALEVAQYAQALRGIAADPQIRNLILSKDEKAREAKAAVLKAQFPGALRLRLLPAKLFSPDKSSEPHLGFACLDLQREAEKKRAQPPVEIHAYATPQQHIDIVQPVFAVGGKEVVGHVQLALNVAFINTWLKKVDVEAHVEIKQPIPGKPALMLGQVGDSAIKADGALAETSIDGTAWKVTVWSPQPMLSYFNLNLLIIIVAGMVISGLAVYLIRNALSRAIKTDLESFMRYEASYLLGNKRHEFTLILPEFKLAAGRVENLMAENSMERERDDDADSISMKNISATRSMDPMFITESAMDVQEIEGGSEMFREMEHNDTAEAATAANAAAQSSAPPKQAAIPGVPPAEIFKAYDIRGIVGKTLTAQHMMLIGQALGSEAISRGLGKIAFARDGRLSGPELGGALVKGLQAAGVDVVDVGMVPTPVLYYAAAEMTEGTGVMLTGSHNPPDYNGIKMVLGGETLSGDTIQALRQRVISQDFTRGSGNYQTFVITNKYIERITSDVKLERALKIVVDCGNGVAGVIAPKLFKALGCEVTELYSEVDGKFPNHHPDPSKPQNLQDLIETVRAQDADVGLAFDGDGDRLGVVSPNGSIIWPDRLMILFAADVLSRNHGAQIIYDIKCSNNLTKAIWEKGGEPLMWKTGHSLIKAKMQQSGALLAGEMSGHIFFKERWYGFDDGLYSAARLLEILAKEAKAPREIFSSLPDAVNTPELNLDMAEGEHFKFMDALLETADFPGANVTMIDGIRVDYEDAWGLVRASNTTPCLVLRFEGKDKDALQRIQDEFRKAMLEVNPNLKLPF